MSSYYYSFEIYIFYSFVLVCSILFIKCVFFEILFHIQTFVDEKGEYRETPKETRLFFIGISLIATIGLVFFIFNSMLSLLYCLPEIFSNSALEVEVLSTHSNMIFIFWLAVLCVFLGRNARILLKRLVVPIKEDKQKITVYWCNKESSITIVAETFILIINLLLMLGFKIGFYNNVIAKLWDVLMVALFILVLVEGVFNKWKIVIYRSGLVTCSKCLKKACFTKEDIQVRIQDKMINVYFEENEHLRGSFEKNDEMVRLLNKYKLISRVNLR